MATKAELLEIAKQALQEGDEATAQAVMDDIERMESQPKEPQGLMDSINTAITDSPFGRVVSEGAAAVNRGAAQVADFVTTTPVNAALELAGSDRRLPSIEGMLAPATQGNFMQPGLARDVVRGAGEAVPASLAVGGVLRSAATPLTGMVTGEVGNVGILPSLSANTEGIGSTFLRSAAQGTAQADAGFGAISGTGQEVGQAIGGDTGGMIGSVVAPLTASGGALALSSILKAGKSGIDSMLSITTNMSEDGASKMLAEAMTREGLSPDDVAKKIADMGEEGMLADVGNNFARLLRTASNKIPRIEGAANKSLGSRQAGQGDRLANALDDATGTSMLNVDDEIVRLEASTAPKIKELYDAARDTAFTPSARLKGLLEGDNAIGNAAKKAQESLNDLKAIGEEVTDMTLINETKKVLDAQISKAVRDGDNGTQSRLIKLKKVMVEEADKAAPEYGQARSMFAGKETLKNAAELGENFFKTNQRDLSELTSTMGDSEKRMYKLGAKQAITDRFDNINANADLVSRTFGKNGDIYKLRTLFDSPDQFNQFRNVLEQEANWTMTRRAAQANSTTVKQAADEISAQEALSQASAALTSPLAAANVFGRMMAGFGKKKGEREFVESLEIAGDILLAKGMKPEAVRDLLIKGNKDTVTRAVKLALPMESTSKRGSIGAGVLGSTLSGSTQAASQ